MKLAKFKEDVIRELQRRELTDIRYVGLEQGRYCDNDRCEGRGVEEMRKFRAIRIESDRSLVPIVVYGCPSCRHVVMEPYGFRFKPIMAES